MIPSVGMTEFKAVADLMGSIRFTKQSAAISLSFRPKLSGRGGSAVSLISERKIGI
jgi:hypothetical protein